MEIKITVEKKYAWTLLLTVVAVGVVLAYGTTNPPVMGHSIGELQGVAPNCEVAANDPVCAGPKSSGWNLGGVSAWAGIAWNSERLGGASADQFCRKDGTNCPPKPTFTQCEERTIQKGYSAYEAEVRCAADETFVSGGCLGTTSGFKPLYDSSSKRAVGWWCNGWGQGISLQSAYAVCCK